MLFSILGTAGTALASGASSLFSALQARKAREAQQAERDRQQAENTQWYNVKKAEDYTQRSDAQAILQKQRELLDERYKRAEATNAVAGGTDASLAAQKEAANNAVAESTAELAQGASAYKDNIEAQYRQTQNQIKQAEADANAQYHQGVANSIAQAGSALGKALGQAGQSAQAWRDANKAKNQGGND